MVKILTVVGARPQIIKAAALSRAIRDVFSDRVEEKILHTGQHYDVGMSQVFFDELGIPKPDYYLGVGSGKHGEQTAKIISGIEKVLLSEHFDGVVLYGDTNSTLAGAVAAVKQHVPIFHIEAGLRSYNMAMPEEINRIACDQMSSILFAPTQTAIENLRKEGFMDIEVRFKYGKERQVFNSGDIMYDNSLYFAKFSGQTKILESNSLQANNYILATIHRDNNTDNPARLESIFRALLHISYCTLP
jgi:UDP-GlcNAc3NAcA epimerase